MPFSTLISTASLSKNLGRPDWVICDCRFSLADLDLGRRQFVEAHIPGAVYVHLNDDLSGPIQSGVTGRHPLPDRESFMAKLGAWGIDHSVQVIAYDDAFGSIAARLWWMLRWVGHEDVAVLDGGWAEWVRQNQQTNSVAETRDSRRFIEYRSDTRFVDVRTVEKATTSAGWKIVDARATERYRGENEPIDAVAGHIPQAISHPYMCNLNNAGLFRSPKELRDQFQKLLDTHPAERTIFYCGSGVTACHNLLAYAHAGLGDANLYAGSWSEWIVDPQHGIATS